MALFGKKKKRTLVIGLDGVPYSLLLRFAADGTMPNIARLAELGHLSKMKVTLPEISAVSWPSFMTGSNPGTHGIFGFVDPKPMSYDFTFPNFGDLKVPTFWDRLGEEKKHCVVINQPSTYPARAIPGILVSGFVAISMEKAVYPARVLDDLKRMGYQIDIDTSRSREDHDFLVKELDKTFLGRVQAVDHFWKTEDWDYLQVVITGTDRLQHYIWDALDDESHVHHTAFINYYRKIDQFIGRHFDRFQEASGRGTEGEGFFLLSDHGFTGIEQEVRLNNWLADNGFLSFGKDPPDSLNDMDPKSVAFAVDPGRIFVNRRGRFPKGGVDDGSAGKVAAEIKAGLAGLTHHGKQVIEHVLTREEAYSGPETPKACDLVAVGHHGFDLKGTIKEKDLFGRTNLTGMHTWDDAFFWSLQAPPPDLNITQLAEMITRATV